MKLTALSLAASKCRYKFYMLLTCLLPIAANAQFININDIHKIVIKTTFGGMNGSVSSTFEVTKKKETWVSNRIKKTSSSVSPETERQVATDSTATKFVSIISLSSINKLVYAIGHPVKSFYPQLFGITAEVLKARADSLLGTMISQPDKQQKAIFKQAITTERVNQAILKTQSSAPLDAGAECLVNIVKTNGDTLKLGSTSLTDYVLPWKLNGKQDAYNINISLFCAMATGAKNDEPVAGGDIYQTVCRDIYSTYCKAQITTAFFENKYPEAFKLLKSYYSITGIRTSDILQAADPVVFMTLHSPGLPDIYTALHVSHTADVLKLTQFKGAVESIVKHKNFVFNYVLNAPEYRLVFQDPNDSLSTYGWEQSTFTYLKPFPQQTVTEFRVQSQKSDNEFSTWYILPNDEIVLSFFNGNNILNFSKKDLRLDGIPYPGGQVCVVFEATGKVIHNFTYGQ